MTDETDGQGCDKLNEGGPELMGIGLRLLIVITAFGVGIVWIFRLLFTGPGIADGLLFELLPPFLILYFGMQYFRQQIKNVRQLRRHHNGK